MKYMVCPLGHGFSPGSESVGEFKDGFFADFFIWLSVSKIIYAPYLIVKKFLVQFPAGKRKQRPLEIHSDAK
jgi:hypothetical protein